LPLKITLRSSGKPNCIYRIAWALLNKRVGTGLQDSPAGKPTQEHNGMYKHPGRMDCFTCKNHKEGKYNTICYSTNRYSVPDHLIGKMVLLRSILNGSKYTILIIPYVIVRAPASAMPGRLTSNTTLYLQRKTVLYSLLRPLNGGNQLMVYL